MNTNPPPKKWTHKRIKIRKVIGNKDTRKQAINFINDEKIINDENDENYEKQSIEEFVVFSTTHGEHIFRLLGQIVDGTTKKTW